MKHKTNTRSSLFLMELIITILFFSLASAVCLRMFAKSHQLSTDASVTNQAVNQTANIAELIRYDLIHNSHTLSDEYPDADITDDFENSSIYFDENWNPCSQELASYVLTIQEQVSSDTLKKFILDVYDVSGSTLASTTTSEAKSISPATPASTIYELPLSIHIAREVRARE